LRGRGGAGFPTGLKWEAAAALPVWGSKLLFYNRVKNPNGEPKKSPE